MNQSGQFELRGILGAIAILSLLLAIGRLAASFSQPDEVWLLMSLLTAAGLCGSVLWNLLRARTRAERLVSALFAAIATWIVVLSMAGLLTAWVTATSLGCGWATLLVLGHLIRRIVPRKGQGNVRCP